MHDTLVKMKDGREFCGPIWEFNPKGGYLTLSGEDADTNSGRPIHFKDMASAITKGQRVGVVDGRTGTPRLEDQDEIARARREGLDGYAPDPAPRSSKRPHTANDF